MQQEQDRVLNTSMFKNIKTFSEGYLVYLLGLHASSLQRGTTEFCYNYVGPLVINTVLDFTHYKLRDVEERVLSDTFHIKRLKTVFVLTLSSTVNTQGWLNKAIQGTNN